LCAFFQRNTDSEKNCKKYGGILQVLVVDSLGWHKIFEKFSQQCLDKTQQNSGQTDEYSPRKKIKQFHTQTNFPFRPDSDN